MTSTAALKDPMTPLDTLLDIGKHHPVLFMKHPLVRLSLATSASFIERLLDTAHRMLLTNIIAAGKGHGPEFLRKVATHPKTSILIHRHIVQSQQITKALARHYLRDDEHYHPLLAKNPALDATLVRYFAQSQSLQIRGTIAERTHLPDPAVKRLLRDKSDVVRFKLARNPSCPRWALARLLEDEVPAISHSARKSMGDVVPCPALEAWVATHRKVS